MVAPGTGLPSDAYVAIVKQKMAELGAIESCRSNRLVPLIEIVSPATAERAVARAWSRPSDVAWLHALNLEDEDEAVFANAIESLFAALRGANRLAPVVTPTEGPDVLAAVSRITSTDNYGFVLRVDAEEILENAGNTSANIASTISAVGLTHPSIDLVVDLGLIDGSPVIQAAVADQCLRSLPNLASWRSVVLAFSGFPIPLSTLVPANSVRAVPRTDAAAFTAARVTASRNVVFADYTLGSPNYDSVPFTPIPNIRYAAGDEWVIHRATERKGPAAQFRKLAADVVAAPYFRSAVFSPGDQQIEDVASGASGPGNPTTHLRAGISRHLHVVLERLATLGGP